MLFLTNQINLANNSGDIASRGLFNENISKFILTEYKNQSGQVNPDSFVVFKNQKP